MAVSQSLSVTEVAGSVDNTANTSKVRILWQSTQTGDSWNGYTRTAKYYISINGGAETEYSVSYTLPQNSTKTIVDKTITVTHKTDGTGTVKVRTWMDTSISAGVVEKSETLTLSTIPRASTIDSLSCATKYFTGKMTYKYTPKSLGYYNRCNISLKIDGEYIAVKSINLGKKAASQQTATVTLSKDELETIYNKLPRTDKGTLRFTFRTYSDSEYSTQIGDLDYKEVTLYIPDDETTKPSLLVTVAPSHTFTGDFASLYIQGYSKVKADIVASGRFESKISSIKMEVGGKSYGSDDDYTSDYLSSIGKNTVKVTVTDTRGFSQSEPIDITVIPYSKPRVVSASNETAIICARCDEDGNLTDSGTSLKIKAKRSYSPCLVEGVQTNFCGLRFRYKKVKESNFSVWVKILDPTNMSTDEADPTLLKGSLLATDSYIVEVGALDSLGNEAKSITFEIPTDKVFMHKAGSRRSVAFGKYVEEDNAIEVADDIKLLLGGNVAEAVVATSEGDSSGSVKYASGLTIQWGKVSVTPSAANTPTSKKVTFPTPYRSIPFVVTNSASSVPGTKVLGTSAANVTKADFDAVVTRTDTTETNIRWMAIGFCE